MQHESHLDGLSDDNCSLSMLPNAIVFVIYASMRTVTDITAGLISVRNERSELCFCEYSRCRGTANYKKDARGTCMLMHAVTSSNLCYIIIRNSDLFIGADQSGVCCQH